MTTPRDALAAALDILDVIDGIVDDTHPEGDGCPLCTALDELRAALASQGYAVTRSEAGLDVERLARVIDAAIVDDESGMETMEASAIARAYAAALPVLDDDVMKMLRRVAGISMCSQTHHEFLGRDAKALLARLAADPEPSDV